MWHGGQGGQGGQGGGVSSGSNEAHVTEDCACNCHCHCATATATATASGPMAVRNQGTRNTSRRFSGHVLLGRELVGAGDVADGVDRGERVDLGEVEAHGVSLCLPSLPRILNDL